MNDDNDEEARAVSTGGGCDGSRVHVVNLFCEERGKVASRQTGGAGYITITAEAREVFCSLVSKINPPVSASDWQTFLGNGGIGSIGSFQLISGYTEGLRA